MRLPLLAVSGDELVRALKRGGFRLAEDCATAAVLEQGLKRFTVPRGRRLEPEELLAILRASGVSYPELVEWLDAPKYESSVRRRVVPDRLGGANLSSTKKAAR